MDKNIFVLMVTMGRKGMSTVGAIILISCIVGAIVVLITIMNMDESLSHERFVANVTYEGEYVAATESSFGGNSLKYYQFKLENGGIISIPSPLLMKDNGAHKKGESATVYYRKGHFTGRPLYDSFEFPGMSVHQQ